MFIMDSVMRTCGMRRVNSWHGTSIVRVMSVKWCRPHGAHTVFVSTEPNHHRHMLLLIIVSMWAQVFFTSSFSSATIASRTSAKRIFNRIYAQLNFCFKKTTTKTFFLVTTKTKSNWNLIRIWAAKLWTFSFISECRTNVYIIIIRKFFLLESSHTCIVNVFINSRILATQPISEKCSNYS